MALQVQITFDAAHLLALGEFDEPEGRWITLLDPEGNEFCLH